MRTSNRCAPRLVTTTITACLLYLLSGFAFGEEPLPLASVSAIAVEVDSGTTRFAKNAEVILPIASITKLMTALVVIESGASLTEWLKVTDWDAAQAKNAYSRIRIDSQAKRADLLRIALMSSENRAAFNLGVHYRGGVQGLVNAMNTKAAALGMSDTHFADPTGLSTDNKSSARDLAKMVIAAHAHPELQKYSTTRQHTVNFQQPRYRLGYGNTNPLLGGSRWQVFLTKTGYLREAGRCLVMVTRIDGKPIAVVLLNSFGKRSPLGDAGRIRRWLEEGIRSEVASAAKAHEQRVSSALGL